MHAQKSLELLERLIQEYEAIPSPKYKNAPIQWWKEKLHALRVIRKHFYRDRTYLNFANAVSQIIARLERSQESRRDTYNLASERGVNKSIPVIMKKRGNAMEFPLELEEGRSGTTIEACGYWGPKNYMVLDVLGHSFLMNEGGGKYPEKYHSQQFEHLDDVRRKEQEINDNLGIRPLPPAPLAQQSLDYFRNTQCPKIRLDDNDFRHYTGMKFTSNIILNLIHNTSSVEFKLAFPVRLGGEKGKEKQYMMNCYSRLFEFGYIDKKKGSDGRILNREYWILFRTILAELFVHNLKSRNFDHIDNAIYKLPDTAQLFYRKFLIHNNFMMINCNLSTIVERLALSGKNITKTIETIEQYAFEQLKGIGLIESFEKREGQDGIKYLIKRTKEQARKEKKGPQTERE